MAKGKRNGRKRRVLVRPGAFVTAGAMEDRGQARGECEKPSEGLYHVRYMEYDGIRLVFRKHSQVAVSRDRHPSLGNGPMWGVGSEKTLPVGASPFWCCFWAKEFEVARDRYIRNFFEFVYWTLLIPSGPGMHKAEMGDRDSLRELIQGVEVYRPGDKRGLRAAWWAERVGELPDKGARKGKFAVESRPWMNQRLPEKVVVHAPGKTSREVPCAVVPRD